MGELILDPAGLEGYLPHRLANLLLDEVVLAADRMSSAGRVQVPVDDPRGRRIFGRGAPDGTWCWHESFLGELMALTGVSLLGERLRGTGSVGVFSTISRAVFHRLVPMDAEAQIATRITRQRSDFSVFVGTVSSGGRLAMEAEVLSGTATLAEIAGGPPRPLCDDRGEAVDPRHFTWKQPEFCWLDRVLDLDAGKRRLLAGYTYPQRHPAVAGHFPGAPLMMGMAQWAAVADAAWEVALRLDLSGSMLASGRIRRPDGTEVMSVRELTLERRDGMPLLHGTKRVAFREPVRPGDGILIEVEVVPCPDS